MYLRRQICRDLCNWWVTISWKGLNPRSSVREACVLTNTPVPVAKLIFHTSSSQNHPHPDFYRTPISQLTNQSTAPVESRKVLVISDQGAAPHLNSDQSADILLVGIDNYNNHLSRISPHLLDFLASQVVIFIGILVSRGSPTYRWSIARNHRTVITSASRSRWWMRTFSNSDPWRWRRLCFVFCPETTKPMSIHPATMMITIIEIWRLCGFVCSTGGSSDHQGEDFKQSGKNVNEKFHPVVHRARKGTEE